MRTLIFGQMLVQKERVNERESHVLVELSCANKKNKSMRTLIFDRTAVAQKKE